MRHLEVVGGLYHEKCTSNDWDQLYGSAGRAASAVTNQLDSVTLRTYASPEVASIFHGYAASYGFDFKPVPCEQTISFEYVHSLSEVIVRPSREYIPQLPPLTATGQAVLRFGMLECTAVVSGSRVVYDPQSEVGPESFSDNGSRADHLAIVANEAEVRRLGGNKDAIRAAKSLLNQHNCEVVVVKAGPLGAFVVTAFEVQRIPAYKTDFVWTIGTGDVFASIFAAQWAVDGVPAVQAASTASRAVAEYVQNLTLPTPRIEDLYSVSRLEVQTVPGKVYLAGPFFNLQQRWLLEESIRCIRAFGLDLFSPFHEVGVGLGSVETAERDLEGLKSCDRVFALVDGLDSGTLFEIGYARSKDIPVYAVAEQVQRESLLMLEGTGCRIRRDFVTALHHLAWLA